MRLRKSTNHCIYIYIYRYLETVMGVRERLIPRSGSMAGRVPRYGRTGHSVADVSWLVRVDFPSFPTSWALDSPYEPPSSLCFRLNLPGLCVIE